jgi:hypothetical protein
MDAAQPDVTEARRDSFGAFDGHKINGLIERVAASNNIGLQSCLDVGCGRAPVTGWFQSIAGKDAPHTGVETDPQIIRVLQERGFDVVNPFTTDRDLSRDLVIAKEVAEHIQKKDAASFFEFCAKNTRKMFAMTTPNFEYWERLKPNDKEMRFMPSHMLHFDPDSEDPHVHKQIMTPVSVQKALRRAFGAGWKIKVYRAWPWRLTDVARSKEWDVYFKIFAIAYKIAD